MSLLTRRVHRSPPGADPYYGQGLLLLHFDGGFTDSSLYARSLTVPSGITNTSGGKFGSGNNTALTTISSFGTNAGIVLASPSSDFDMGTGDFTAEAQIDRGSGGFWTWNPIKCGSDWGISFVASSGTVHFTAAGGVNITYAYTVGGFHHVAGTRLGTTFTLWVDGVSRGTATSSSSLASGTSFALCGGSSSDTGTQTLKVDEIRITKGTALYKSGFTAPTAAFADF